VPFHGGKEALTKDKTPKPGHPKKPTPRKATSRQLKFIKMKIDGASDARAKREAGYSHSTKTKDILKNAGHRFGFLLDKAGLSAELLAQRVREGVDATATVTATRKGRISDAVQFVDYRERREMVSLVLKLCGLYPADKLKVETRDRTLEDLVGGSWDRDGKDNAHANTEQPE
jgi:hypothetical protein